MSIPTSSLSSDHPDHKTLKPDGKRMNLGTMSIRIAQPDDLALLQQLGHQTYTDHFAAIWSPEAMAAFLARDFANASLAASLASPDKQQWLLACLANGEAIGLAKVNWSRPNPINEVVGAELQKIYFLKSYAGLGAGKALLQAVKANALARGETTLWLDVLKSNSDARRFYEATGFGALGELPFSTDLQEIGMVVMSAPLP